MIIEKLKDRIETQLDILERCYYTIRDIEYMIKCSNDDKLKLPYLKYEYFGRMRYDYWSMLLIRINMLYSHSDCDYYRLDKMLEYIDDNQKPLLKHIKFNIKLIEELKEKLNNEEIIDYAKGVKICRNKHLAHKDQKRLTERYDPLIELGDAKRLFYLALEIVSTIGDIFFHEFDYNFFEKPYIDNRLVKPVYDALKN